MTPKTKRNPIDRRAGWYEPPTFGYRQSLAGVINVDHFLGIASFIIRNCFRVLGRVQIP